MRLACQDGATIPPGRFIVPRVEVELAFILTKPLKGPHCTLLDVYDATAYVIPALESIDARSHIDAPAWWHHPPRSGCIRFLPPKNGI
jgi:2-keto-4-pentenoate hydratase